MKTEELIVSLVEDGRPVAPLPPLDARLWRWIALAMPVSAILVVIFGLRHDLAAVAGTPAFVFSGVFSVAVMIAASVAALQLSIPGKVSPIVTAVPAGLLAGWIAVFVLTAFAEGSSAVAISREPWHWACVSRVTLLSAIPSAALMIAVRRGFVLDRGRSAFLAFIAGGALAVGALQFACPIDRAPHVLVSHLVPVLLVSAAAAAVQFLISSRK